MNRFAIVLSALAFTLPACGDLGAGDLNGGGGGGGGGGGNVDPECSQVEQINSSSGDPADLLLVVDKSGSMDDRLQTGERKWPSMRAALGTIVTQYQDGIHFGMSTFPTGADCGSGSVVTDIGPQSGTSINAALGSINPDGGTPTDQTMNGALAYYQSIAENPNGRFVLLATDGEPNCGLVGDEQDPTVAESVAAIARLTSAGIPTFVLGFGGTVNNEPLTLKMMADAGGTDDYFAANNSDELEIALAAIAAEVGVVSCTIRLDQVPDLPGELEVYIDGTAIELGGADGFSYDEGTNSITFNGAACDQLKDGGTAMVEIDLACGEDDCEESCEEDNECAGNSTCDFGCCRPVFE